MERGLHKPISPASGRKLHKLIISFCIKSRLSLNICYVLNKHLKPNHNSPMFKSKSHIISQQRLQQLQCTICYDISADLVRCHGPCHKLFCLKCVSRSKYKQGPCPNRCSKVFQIQPLAGERFSFWCPFRGDGCEHVAQSQVEFETHYKTCKYMNEAYSQQLQHIKNYECPQGHGLTFLTQQAIAKIYGANNYYHIFMNEVCSRCHEVTLCRSICLECSKNKFEKRFCFCTRCRELPCTRTRCPIGHQLLKREGFSYTLTCDFCGLSGLIFGEVAYEDTQCNFDICLRCYEKLEEEHPLIPLQNSLAVGEINQEGQPPA